MTYSSNSDPDELVHDKRYVRMEAPNQAGTTVLVRVDGHSLEEREAYIQAHLKKCKRTTQTKLSSGNHKSGKYWSLARSQRRCAIKSWGNHLDTEAGEVSNGTE